MNYYHLLLHLSSQFQATNVKAVHFHLSTLGKPGNTSLKRMGYFKVTQKLVKLSGEKKFCTFLAMYHYLLQLYRDWSLSKLPLDRAYHMLHTRYIRTVGS